jgi:hypothetical protein
LASAIASLAWFWRPAGLDLGQQLAAALVELQDLVELIRGVATCQRRSRGLGVLANRP